MTWYWWKHWFWITNLLTIIVILSFPLLAETYPVTPIYNKENKKDKISKISLVEQTDSDIDHIFDGRDNLPRELLLIHRDRANHISGGLDKDQLDSSVNHNHHNHQTTDSITESSTSSSSSSLSSIANIFLNSTANNTNSNETHTISNDGENLNEQTNSSKTFINNSNNSSRTTKVVDYSIVINNTSSEIMNNDTINFNRDNHLINIDKNFTLSTTNISSTIINSNTSKLVIVASENKSFICNKTKIDSTVQRSAVESNRTNIKNNNSTVSSIQINNNKTIDCENATNDSEELSSSTLDIDSIENHNNKTTTIHVDLIDDDNDDDDNISSDNNDNIDNNNNNNDKDNKNNANTLIHHMQNKGTKMENITKDEEIIRAEIQRQLDGERGRKSKVLAEYRHELKYINFSSDAKNLLARSAAVSLDFDVHDDDGNVSSEALSIQKAYILDAGTISGICLSVLGLCLAVTLAGIAIYRRRYLNKPQTLSEPDSSGYIDDSTIRDNSDEMYSLDNDSFLNSLEAMTIQNYWTDTVKHTKL